jgi:hypothetical protein
VSRSLVIAEHASLDLAAVAHYRRQFPKIREARDRFYKIFEGVRKIVNLYLEADSRRDLVVALRREIRMSTRGAPATHAMDAIIEASPISNGTEQLVNFDTQLCARLYKSIRSKVHPDHGGDRELFHLVNTAYRLRDQTFLQEVFFMIEKKHDLFWKQSEGLTWVEQELERPKVSLTVLQSTPEFAIVRAHQTGRVEEAKKLADARMAQLVVQLRAELDHILKPHGVVEDGNSSKEGEESVV